MFFRTSCSLDRILVGLKESLVPSFTMMLIFLSLFTSSSSCMSHVSYLLPLFPNLTFRKYLELEHLVPFAISLVYNGIIIIALIGI